MSGQRFAFGPFVLDAEHGTLARDGVSIAVSARGIVLLRELLTADGQPVSKSMLMDAAWPGLAVEESNLSVQVAALRKLLGPSPGGVSWIATVPRLGYRFVDTSEDPGSMQRLPVSGRSGRPSLAVLPFDNVSGDSEQEYLADGITEDTITALARFRWFFVIARNSTFIYKGKSVDAQQVASELGVRYLLQGSVRKGVARMRISAQLIDATAGTHVWGERYDVEMTDVFAVQDEIAERVAGAVEPELLKTEANLAAGVHTGNMTAWDLVRQGTWRFHQFTAATHHLARDFFREACRLDPQLPEAQFWRGRVNAGLMAYGWSEDRAADGHEGLDAAFAAIRLDDRNPYSHYALAIVSVYVGQLDQAIRAAEAAVELSPSFALGHLVLGMARLYEGLPLDAVAALERGLHLSPFDPQNFVWLNLLAIAHLLTGNSKEAHVAALRGLKIRPDWQPTLATIVACCVETGRMDEARQFSEQMQQLKRPPGDAMAPLRQYNTTWAKQLTAALQKVGIEE